MRLGLPLRSNIIAGKPGAYCAVDGGNGCCARCAPAPARPQTGHCQKIALATRSAFARSIPASSIARDRGSRSLIDGGAGPEAVTPLADNSRASPTVAPTMAASTRAHTILRQALECLRLLPPNSNKQRPPF
jgi:hypothetical protein